MVEKKMAINKKYTII